MKDTVQLPRQQKNEVLKAVLQLGGARWQAVKICASRLFCVWWRSVEASLTSADRRFYLKEPETIKSRVGPWRTFRSPAVILGHKHQRRAVSVRSTVVIPATASFLSKLYIQHRWHTCATFRGDDRVKIKEEEHLGCGGAVLSLYKKIYSPPPELDGDLTKIFS